MALPLARQRPGVTGTGLQSTVRPQVAEQDDEACLDGPGQGWRCSGRRPLFSAS